MEGTRANLTSWDPQKDLVLRVCVSNAVGCGPWSQPLVVSSHDHAGKACRWGRDRGFQGLQIGKRMRVTPVFPVQTPIESTSRVWGWFSSLCFGHTSQGLPRVR